MLRYPRGKKNYIHEASNSATWIQDVAAKHFRCLFAYLGEVLETADVAAEAGNRVFFQHFWGFSMGFLGGWWWLEPWNLDWLSRNSWEWNGTIIPTDEVILFRGVAQPPTSINGSLNGHFQEGKSSINRDCSANHVQWGFLISMCFFPRERLSAGFFQ